MLQKVAKLFFLKEPHKQRNSKKTYIKVPLIVEKEHRLPYTAITDMHVSGARGNAGVT